MSLKLIKVDEGEALGACIVSGQLILLVNPACSEEERKVYTKLVAELKERFKLEDKQ